MRTRVVMLGAAMLGAAACHRGIDPGTTVYQRTIKVVVSGTVVDAASNQGLASATAAIRPIGETASFTNGSEVTTSSDGKFSLAPVPAGEYELQVMRMGYKTWSTSVKLHASGRQYTARMERMVTPCPQVLVGRKSVACE